MQLHEHKPRIGRLERQPMHGHQPRLRSQVSEEPGKVRKGATQTQLQGPLKVMLSG
ncbi:hypothetical protein D3C84_1263000 [compost metagenome]